MTNKDSDLEAEIVAGVLRPEITLAVTRGAARVMRDMGLAILPEFILANHRRVDLAGVDKKGRLVFVEVKSCREDFTGDNKWQDYLPYCDEFYWASDVNFPADILPGETGHITADRYGGAVMRYPIVSEQINAARRKSVLLRFARQAAGRLGWDK
ncbi:MAG: MmcB family DNA repair protein [bacterium]